MKKMFLILSSIILTQCLCSGIAFSQPLKQVHLAYEFGSISVGVHDTIVYNSSEYKYTTSAKIWSQIVDPFVGDSLVIRAFYLLPNGTFFDWLSNGWLIRSRDEGRSYEHVYTCSYRPVVTEKSELFVLLSTRLVRSSDEGTTWDTLQFPVPKSASISSDKAGNLYLMHNQVFFLGYGSNLLDSIGECPFNAVGISCSRATGNLFAYGGNFAVTYDSGHTWRNIAIDSLNGQRNFLTSLCLDSNGDIYRAENGNLTHSFDSGRTWLPLDTSRHIERVSAGGRNILLLGSATNSYQLDLRTRSLIEIDSGYEHGSIFGLAARGDSVLAGDYLKGEFFSSNGGSSWKFDTALYGEVGDYTKVVFSPSGFMFLSGGPRLLRSRNGVNWDTVNSGLSIGYGPTIDSDGVIYISYYKSSDDGNTWTPRSLVYPLEVTTTGDICTTDSNFRISHDKGLTWIAYPINDTLAKKNGKIHCAFNSIWISYDSGFDAHPIGGVLLQSLDGGLTWQRAMQGLPDVSQSILATDRFGTTYCSVKTGAIYRWAPKERQWIRMTDDTHISSTGLVCTNNDLLQGTYGGLFRMPLFKAQNDVTLQNVQNVVTVFPDPIRGMLRISTPKYMTGLTEITIFDLRGRKVLNRQISLVQEKTLSLPIDLQNGVYTFDLKSGSRYMDGRFIVVR